MAPPRASAFLAVGIIAAASALATNMVVASGGNCSDPAEYPPNPITRKSDPCPDFCAGKCAFSPTPPAEMTLIRMTPRGVHGIANKDTGDDAGDLFFTLISAIKASQCTGADPPPWAGCFLNGDDIFIKSRVAVDGRWGIYQECNPASLPLPPEQENPGSFACCGSLNCTGGATGPIPPAPPPHNSSTYCFCDRTNHTVGRTSVTDQFREMSKFGPKWLIGTAELVGGNWYSTPAEGECKGDAVPGQGGCTWKVQEILTVINQTCVTSNVYGAVEQHCPAAFEACPSPHYNRSSPCYSEMFFESLLGNVTYGCTGMSRQELLVPWTRSFNGGCPNVTLA